MMDKKSIAITGASGFLGKVLLEKLLAQGYKITVLDSKGSTFPKGVKIIRGNLLNGKGYEEFAQDCEIVIHLAGQVEQGNSTMYQGNVITTRNLLRVLTKKSVRKIIFASSIAVYGSSKVKIFKESDTCRPDTSYGKSKLKAERLIEEWSKKNGKNYVILRFFSLYGYENRKGFVYKLFRNLFDSSSVTITGDGSQERDLVWVDDAADAIILAVTKNVFGIYNVGTGKNYSLLKIISLMEKIAGIKCNIKFVGSDKEKATNIYYQSEKIRKIGWKPKILPEKGLVMLYNTVIKPFTS